MKKKNIVKFCIEGLESSFRTRELEIISFQDGLRIPVTMDSDSGF